MGLLNHETTFFLADANANRQPLERQSRFDTGVQRKAIARSMTFASVMQFFLVLHILAAPCPCVPFCCSCMGPSAHHLHSNVLFCHSSSIQYMLSTFLHVWRSSTVHC